MDQCQQSCPFLNLINCDLIDSSRFSTIEIKDLIFDVAEFQMLKCKRSLHEMFNQIYNRDKKIAAKFWILSKHLL